MRAIHTGPWSITRTVATTAVLGVAAFWTWLAVATDVIAGPVPEALAQSALLILPLLAAGLIAIAAPRYAGLGILVAGLFAAWYAASPGVGLMIALPLVAIGTALAIVGRNPHTPLHRHHAEPTPA